MGKILVSLIGTAAVALVVVVLYNRFSKPQV